MNRVLSSLVFVALAAALLISSAGNLAVIDAQQTTPTADPLGGATEFARADQPAAVQFMLDWTPNTNHLGLYVAQALGYFQEANLTVEIIPPGDTSVEQIVGIGTVDFGISFSEWFSFARAQDLPIVSVAAIMQHNTSGFATLSARHPLKSPADLRGLTYGATGSAVEKPFIDALLACQNSAAAGSNAGDVAFVNVGFVDLVALLEREKVDFVWLFYGWDGIRAKQAGLPLDILMLKDYPQCVPDYYTPILITNQQLVSNRPDVVRAFVQAVARGYAYAIQNPAEAADMLLKAAPDLDPALVKDSAAWLADQFQADAPRWGEQKAEIWERFVAFMEANRILDKDINIGAAWTNDFLPGGK